MVLKVLNMEKKIFEIPKKKKNYKQSIKLQLSIKPINNEFKNIVYGFNKVHHK